MELNLAGKSVVVTGGGSNIGRAITLAFARERSHVTIAEIDEGQGKKVAAEASSAGAASAAVVRTDVTKWEAVQKETRLTLWGMINCPRAVLDGMIARKSGAIVSLGSDAGRMGEFREGVYAACKAGVIALSKSLAREVGRYNIRLNVVCPGMTMPEPAEETGGG